MTSCTRLVEISPILRVPEIKTGKREKIRLPPWMRETFRIKRPTRRPKKKCTDGSCHSISSRDESTFGKADAILHSYRWTLPGDSTNGGVSE